MPDRPDLPAPPPRDPHVDLLDDARLAEAVRERAEARLRRQVDVDAATLAGTLRDLAERGAPVSIDTTAGRRHRGQLVGLAADHLVLLAAGARVLVRLDAVAVVRPRPGSGGDVAAGDRGAGVDLLLTEALARLAADRPTVVAVPAGAEPVRGILLAVGGDVVTLRPDGTTGLAYLPTATLVEVAVEP
ncbi:MAG: hypothetical protein ACLGIR_00395 [Actinomycetes bacterium]